VQRNQPYLQTLTKWHHKYCPNSGQQTLTMVARTNLFNILMKLFQHGSSGDLQLEVIWYPKQVH
jgi:hypothetical protein